MAEKQTQGPGDVPTEKRMEHLTKAVALALTVEAKGAHETNEAAGQRSSTSEVERLIEDWAPAPKMTAQMMMERYGAPNEATHARLIWHESGNWKRITVTRDVYTHHFPMPHTDFLSMTIDYKVPIDKLADVTRLDGSIIVDRTAGEVTSRCDSEAADILTLNLMHDVVTGTRSVEEARKFFAEHLPSFIQGNPEPYVERLQVPTGQGETQDVDETLVAKVMVEKVQEKAKKLM